MRVSCMSVFSVLITKEPLLGFGRISQLMAEGESCSMPVQMFTEIDTVFLTVQLLSSVCVYDTVLVPTPASEGEKVLPTRPWPAKVPPPGVAVRLMLGADWQTTDGVTLKPMVVVGEETAVEITVVEVQPLASV